MTRFPFIAAPMMIRGDSAIVRLPDREAVITAPAALLKQVFLSCDGNARAEDIRRRLAAKWDRRNVSQLLAALEGEGILVEADHALASQWRRGENPPRVGGEVPPELGGKLARASALRAFRRPAGAGYAVRDFPLRTLLKKRASVRHFAGTALPAETVASILWAAYGVRAASQARGREWIRRTVPSGGALYPLKLWLVNFIQSGRLGSGVHEVGFTVNDTVTLARKTSEFGSAFRAFADPGVLRSAQGVLVIGGAFPSAARKYGNRAVGYVALEAGHAAQNALLAASQLGAGAVEVGGFLEGPLRRLLGLASTDVPLTTIVIGTPAAPDEAARQPEREHDFRWVELAPEPAGPDFFLGMVPSPGGENGGYRWGRSRDALTAYDKAMYESLERDACMHEEGTYRARAEDLKDALDPRTVVAYSAAQYRRSGFPYRPFDPGALYSWKNGIDLHTDRRVPVLADLVYFRTAAGKAGRYTAATSSGVAAYPSAEGALERAVAELCERDAFMRTWLAGCAPPRLEAGSLPRPAQRALRRLGEAGFEVCVVDLTNDLLPAMLAVAQHPARGFTIVGAAADYDPGAAVDQALMEAESSAVLRLESDAAPGIVPSKVRYPGDHADLYAQHRYFLRAQFLVSGPRRALRPAGQAAAQNFGQLLDRLHSKGCQVIALDLGRRHVVRAVIPGLVPISFGYGTEPLGLVCLRDVPAAGRRRACFPHPFP